MRYNSKTAKAGLDGFVGTGFRTVSFFWVVLVVGSRTCLVPGEADAQVGVCGFGDNTGRCVLHDPGKVDHLRKDANSIFADWKIPQTRTAWKVQLLFYMIYAPKPDPPFPSSFLSETPRWFHQDHPGTFGRNGQSSDFNEQPSWGSLQWFQRFDGTSTPKMSLRDFEIGVP